MNFIVSDPPMGVSPCPYYTPQRAPLLWVLGPRRYVALGTEDSKHQAQVEYSQVECSATHIPSPYWTSLHTPNSSLSNSVEFKVCAQSAWPQ